MRKGTTRHPGSIANVIREFGARGYYGAAIARMLGVSDVYVHLVCKRHGITLPRHTAQPIRKTRAEREAEIARAALPVPRWVPADLQEDYRDLGVAYGEEHAASVIRAMKRDGAAA